MIILDTNVLSEVIKPLPSREVVEWLARQQPHQVFTTAITQVEILYGIELVAGGRRRVALVAAAEAMFQEDFAGRILPFDDQAARVFPRIAAARRQLGRPISQLDAQIAAIARSRDAAIATRNTKDFEHCEVSLLNPWKGR